MDTQTNHMLRAPAVMAQTGLSRVTIWRKVRDGTFPPPVELGPNSIGWPESIIASWLRKRPRRTYGGPTSESAEATT